MKTLLIPTLLLTLLFSACSKPEEEAKAADDTSATEAPAEAAVAPTAPTDLETAVTTTPETATEKTKQKSVNYQPVLLQTIEGAENIAALQVRVQEIQSVNENRAKLAAQIAEETDPAKLSELEAALSAIEKVFADQNDQLIKEYNVDLDSTNEYLFVAQKLEVLVQLEADSAMSDADSTDAGFVVTKEIVGQELINQFIGHLEQVAQIRKDIASLEQALTQATEKEAQTQLTSKIIEVTGIYQEANQKIFDAYGYTFDRPSKTQNKELSIYSQPPLPKLNEVDAIPDDYIYIGQLEGVETNLEFERNLKVMEAARSQAERLAQSVSNEEDEAKKAELQKEFDTLVTKINEDNQTMVKAYKYSLDRSYSQVVTKARLYIQLTEEEIAAKKEKDPDYTPAENGFEALSTINGAESNLAFQKDTQMMERMRAQIIEVTQALALETDEETKATLQEFIEQATERLTEVNKTMAEVYKYSITRKYEYVVENSDLYLQLSREEISNL